MFPGALIYLNLISKISEIAFVRPIIRQTLNRTGDVNFKYIKKNQSLGSKKLIFPEPTLRQPMKSCARIRN